jgi:serine protease Do
MSATLCGSGQAPAADDKPQAKASLGVVVEPAPRDADSSGVVVGTATPDGPAAKAGIKAGDKIVKIDDTDVKQFDILAATVGKHKPGDKVTVHVLRDGQDKSFTVTLGERPEPRPMPLPPGLAPERPAAFLGVQTQELTAGEKERLGVTVDKGVVITDVVPQSSAARAGLKNGDVITGIDGTSVTNPEELRRAVREASVGKEVTLKVARGKEMMEIKARLGENREEQAFGGPLGRFRSDLVVPFGQERQRIEQLERRIEELEKRLQELEKKPGK